MAAFLADNFGDGNYEIVSLDQLENSAASLARYIQQISNNKNSLNFVLKSVQQNWENEAGQDLQSIITNLNDAIRVLSEDIQPILSKYVETINAVVTETRANQSQSM